MSEPVRKYPRARDFCLDDEVVDAGAHEQKVGRLEAELAAARTSLSEAAGVPEGWKLVPIDPTQAMVDALADAVYYHHREQECRLGYKAALLNVPEAPK